MLHYAAWIIRQCDQRRSDVSLPYNQRTCYCGEVSAEHVGKSAILVGWVANRRDLGGMVFIDLRDREGTVQVKIDSDTDPQAHQIAHRLRNEFCIALRGDVVARPEKMVNTDMRTGAVEIIGREIEVLSESETPKFAVDDEIETNEEVRLKYRFLDLRRPRLQNAIRTRHRLTKVLRDYFDGEGFVEIETPFLTRSTPEGARDFLVPSRVQLGHFYALPQSPQLFKQLLMMSGFDKYMQIVRCFRDEDLRADRQPEFTQLDVEMSFVQPENIINVIEGCMVAVMREIHGIEVPRPFPRMSYAQAMADYGIDRPDTRYDLRLIDVTEIAQKTGFKVFTEAVDAGGVVRAIRLPGGAEMPRKKLDALTEELKGIGAGGLPLVKVAADGDKLIFETGVAKFFSPELTAETATAMKAEPGDVLFFSADTETNVCKYLSWLRQTIAQRRGLIPEGLWNFLWVLDFPMFEYSTEDGRHYAMHHPFTAPLDEDIPLLDDDNPGKCRAKAYDIVLNGTELGGGSIRIHRADVQEKVFQLLDIGPAEQRHKFGFLLDALKYGPPPHGGIALGLDRMVMLLAGLESLRDTIAFPKTHRAVCMLTEAPGTVATEQLDELGIRLVNPPDA
ncbi:MAG: aspartate--tRNA ligase [Phycisphaerae bacterium]|nr:aspartate--tRNA ligase [Phycisphaerae bacterium]